MLLKHLTPALLWAAFILVLCGIPGSQLPEVPFWDIFSFDKAAHVAVFLVLSVLLKVAFLKQIGLKNAINQYEMEMGFRKVPFLDAQNRMFCIRNDGIFLQNRQFEFFLKEKVSRTSFFRLKFYSRYNFYSLYYEKLLELTNFYLINFLHFSYLFQHGFFRGKRNGFHH